ncbi:hypothetical protein RvY_07723 [Ramazzottius varieornatus]|uniref:Peptidase M20 domain-containing protein 2 n=1 Tax=Ramazzottius varieornatus TaxID=947166 RepID=A0A1D1V882_RAMVA|nr:hypothetical protein RvY_07723 [Ramazzottius varieornatus]
MANQPMVVSEQLESIVQSMLEDHAERLAVLATEIWKNPELNYKEVIAAKLLTDYLKENGHNTTQPYGGLQTAFLAQYQTANFDASKHPTVAVLCEYDALPEIGHACGHNLIAEAGIGTFIAATKALENSNLQGRVRVVGSPAEEGGGGKVRLLHAGAFEDVDFAMMVHPSPLDILHPPILAIDHGIAEFHGRASHASLGPSEGLNALDAVVQAYNNLAMLRQQLKPKQQLHMIIAHGGDRPNVIPSYTRMEYHIRAPTQKDIQQVRAKVALCFQAAALATGCQLEQTLDGDSYSALMSNHTMLSVFKHYQEKQGTKFPPIPDLAGGSTDMGDVSINIPSIHPGIFVGKPIMIHTKEFQMLAGTPEAHGYVRKAAASMAMLTLELLANPLLREKVRAEFAASKLTFVG